VKLFIATQNANKLKEIEAILHVPGLVLQSMRDRPDLPEVVEDGETFEANAKLKAVTIAAETGLWTLGDDSGLNVEALGGAPGVYSARYSGEPVDPARNIRKLLNALEGVSDRRARFRCVLALAQPNGDCQTLEGRCEGRIADASKGENGFGYDPVFIPADHDLTFGESDPGFKNRVSHRAKALDLARETWGHLFAADEAEWPG
jgi:XTP/dITP diphosphohydrolase